MFAVLLPIQQTRFFAETQIVLSLLTLCVLIALVCGALLRGWRPQGKDVFLLAIAMGTLFFAGDLYAFSMSCDWYTWYWPCLP